MDLKGCANPASWPLPSSLGMRVHATESVVPKKHSFPSNQGLQRIKLKPNRKSLKTDHFCVGVSVGVHPARGGLDLLLRVDGGDGVGELVHDSLTNINYL